MAPIFYHQVNVDDEIRQSTSLYASTSFVISFLGWLLVVAVIALVMSRYAHRGKNQQRHRDERYGLETENKDRNGSTAGGRKGYSRSIHLTGRAWFKAGIYVTRYANNGQNGLRR